jgi:hypothetical protein
MTWRLLRPRQPNCWPCRSGSGSKLLDTERDAWKHVTAGAAWQRLKQRLGIAGHIIAL